MLACGFAPAGLVSPMPCITAACASITASHHAESPRLVATDCPRSTRPTVSVGSTKPIQMTNALPSAIVHALAVTGARISAPARIEPSQKHASAAPAMRGLVSRGRADRHSTPSPTAVATAIGTMLVRI